MPRLSKSQYYLNIAEAVATRSTCLRRNYGAVIVNGDRIVSTGYNGSPRGCVNCLDRGVCWREEHQIPRGTHSEACFASGVHSEQNAIINAGRDACIGGTLYLYGFEASTGEPVANPDCCQMCKRAIINAGLKEVIFSAPTVEDPTATRIVLVEDWVKTGAADPNLEGY